MAVALEPVVAEVLLAHPFHLDSRLVDAAVVVGDAVADVVDVDAWGHSLHLGGRLVDAAVVVVVDAAAAAVAVFVVVVDQVADAADAAQVAADVVAYVVVDAAVAVDVAQVAARVHRSPAFHQSSLEGTAGPC